MVRLPDMLNMDVIESIEYAVKRVIEEAPRPMARTSDFDSENVGSTPTGPATMPEGMTSREIDMWVQGQAHGFKLGVVAGRRQLGREMLDLWISATTTNLWDKND